MQLGLLAFLVLAGAIITFFSEEFGRFFKKLFKTTWTRVLLPLVIFSGLFFIYYNLVFGVLLMLQNQLRNSMIYIVKLLPFQGGATFITEVTCLFVLASLPTLGLYWLLKLKRWGDAMAWATRTYAALWFFLIILWIA